MLQETFSIPVVTTIATLGKQIRYSNKELEEFSEIIEAKLVRAREDYEQLRASIVNTEGNDVLDTSPTFKPFEEIPSTLLKEENAHLADRQMKFIQNLEAAQVRIENKTYGICRETGRLIPKERLKAVPHATLSIEAKAKN